MKISIYIFLSTIFLCALVNNGYSQTINWKSFQSDDKHLINVNTGWDYGTNFGIGYGYKLNLKIPVVLGTEFSLPPGEKLFDDFKSKIGGQAEVYRIKNFSATIKINGIFRRYESEFVRLLSFGSEFSAIAGYYKPKWYMAIEFGFDKAITTHIKNSTIMKESYPAIRDGWYLPTGGNLFYGIQAGHSFRSYDAYLKVGKTITQDFKTSAAIPFYLQLGLNKRF